MATLSRDQIKLKLDQIIRDRFSHAGALVPERSALVDDLGADSLDLIEFPMEIEDAFGINFPDRLEPNLTVLQLVDMIEAAAQ